MGVIFYLERTVRIHCSIALTVLFAVAHALQNCLRHITLFSTAVGVDPATLRRSLFG